MGKLRPTLEEQAESGDVVYIDPDATLVPSDISYDYADNIPVPAGVTLASDRGIDGAPGGHVHTDLSSWPVFDIEEGARVTGLRLSGPRWDWIEYDEEKRDLGIRALGPDTEIDNCELWGFGHGAVGKGNSDDHGTFSFHVHSNYIHHNPMDGLGYGVISGTHDVHDVIEYNRFENNKHSINGGGSGGYTARFNHVVGESIAHHFDIHRPGGTWIHIHHNTFEPWESEWEDEPNQGVSIRGIPEEEAWIHHNWFHNPHEPLTGEQMDPDEFTREAITQQHVHQWNNVRFNENHYGETPPPQGVGSPSRREDILEAMP